MPSMPFIFISYSHKDSEYANRLADSLEAKGIDTWMSSGSTMARAGRK